MAFWANCLNRASSSASETLESGIVGLVWLFWVCSCCLDREGLLMSLVPECVNALIPSCLDAWIYWSSFHTCRYFRRMLRLVMFIHHRIFLLGAYNKIIDYESDSSTGSASAGPRTTRQRRLLNVVSRVATVETPQPKPINYLPVLTITPASNASQFNGLQKR